MQAKEAYDQIKTFIHQVKDATAKVLASKALMMLLKHLGGNSKIKN